MPLFFLLSGFCLTLGYGKKVYDGFTFCCNKPNKEKEIFDSKEFYIGRLTRILPVYYATWLIAFPLMFLGHSYFPLTEYKATIGGLILIFRPFLVLFLVFLVPFIFLFLSFLASFWSFSVIFWFLFVPFLVLLWSFYLVLFLVLFWFF